MGLVASGGKLLFESIMWQTRVCAFRYDYVLLLNLIMATTNPYRRICVFELSPMWIAREKWLVRRQKYVGSEE